MFPRYNMIGHDVCPLNGLVLLLGLFLFKIELAGCDQGAAHFFRMLSGVMQREMTPQGSVKLPYLLVSPLRTVPVYRCTDACTRDI